ncbi:MAG: leucine-rich repeat protein, partial [Bacteroidales bacterium]|nr:leucine-rich repeat protein [Bacteroidales bacterium]
AFNGCNNIQTLNWNAKNCATYNSAFSNKTSITSLTIGDSVQVIPSSAFSGCSGLTSITIPNSVTSIGGYAFNGCSGLTSVTIPNSVTSVGYYAFYNCRGLTSVTIGNSVTSIGEYAFSGCSSLTSVTIGNSVTNIRASTFSNTLQTLNFNAINCNASFKNYTNLTTLHIGEGVEKLCDSIFPGCTGLTNVVIPSTLDSIGKRAFRDCTNLTLDTLDLLNVKYVGDSAFYNCDEVLNLKINAKKIGKSAFNGCDRLFSVHFGDSVKSIGPYAFYNCSRLSQTYFKDNVDTINNYVFYNCRKLDLPTLPKSLKYIGDYAFSRCVMFNGELTIPSSVDYIGNYAFDSCRFISSINVRANTPPTLYANTFRTIPNTIPVYVPCGRMIHYQTSNIWDSYDNISEGIPFTIKTLANDDVMGRVEILQHPTCNSGVTQIQAIPTYAYHFVEWSDGNTINPRTFMATKDTTFTAIFVQNSTNLTIHSSDSLKGVVTGSGSYEYMQTATITAIPTQNNHFVCWNDGNTNNPRNIVVTQDSIFTACFVSNNSSITVQSANPDMGTVNGGGIYYYNNLISISAIPTYGYHFTQWSDGNTMNPRTILIDRDSIFTAQFAINNYTITVNSNNATMGSVTGSGTYTYNTQAGLSATPNYGYHFAQWNDGSTNNPRTVIVEKDSSFTAQFVANTYIVSVEANDQNMGSAYGGGIYNYNSQTTIAAMPTYGYHFTQWSDGNTENPRVVTITSGITFTAIFEINSYNITVTSTNPAMGSASGGGSFSYNMPTNIVATPNYGYHFTQWSDGNTDNPRLINVVQNATYTAQFAVNSYAVSVASNNDMKGSVSGSNSYIYNTPATITATPNYGYHFMQWNDGNTQNPRTFVVTQDVSYTAQFDNNNYTITTNTNNNAIGSVSGAGVYPYNDIIALTANANAHYHFTHWGDGVEDNPRTITILQDSVFTAYFEIDTHSVVLNTNDIVKGSVSGAGVYNYGSVVNISAMSNYGYHFVSWSDGNTNSSRNIQVTSDTTITANFIENDYNIILYANDTNRGNVYGQGSYSYTSQVILTATAKYGYHFTQWSDGNTDNPRNLQITSDSTLTAIFDKNTYTLTLNTNNNFGTVDGSGTYEYLDEVSISATAVEHYHFLSWNDGNTQNPRTLSIESDTILTAMFVIDTHSVVLNTTDENILTVTGGGEYAYGETITIEAIPIIGYHFTQWSDGDTNNPRQILLTHDTILTASFAINIYHIDVQVNIEEGGEVSGEGDYEYNTLQTISATANTHFHFIQWNDGNTSNPRQILISADSTFTAQFEEDEKYDIIVVSANNAMGTVEGSGTYYLGEQVSITAIPNDGYRFEQWSDGNTENPRQITILQNATYVANFAQGVGLDEVKEDIVVRLYPNPTQDNTTLYLENIKEDVKVILTDIQGRTLQTYTVKSGENSLRLETSSLASGTYYVRIIGNTIQRTEKIIKK